MYYKYQQVYTDGYGLDLQYLQNVTVLQLDRLVLNQNNTFTINVNAMNDFEFIIWIGYCG